MAAASLAVADGAMRAARAASTARSSSRTWLRSEGEAVNLRPEVAEPEAEPSALKPGVAGDECGFTTIKLAEHSLPDLPRRVACGPERLELLLFALGVHTLPKTGVTMGLKLAFAGKACQRFTFQNAIITG